MQMHRARMLPFEILQYDWYHPRIRFVAISRCLLDISGPFEQTIRQLAQKAASRSGHPLPDDTHFAIIPVHELQVHNVTKRVPEAELLHPDISAGALAQSSLRYVANPLSCTISLYFL